jgi:hypothetical protein
VGESGHASIAGAVALWSQTKAVGTYPEDFKVTDANGKTWTREFTLAVVVDTIGANLYTFPNDLSNAA